MRISLADHSPIPLIFFSHSSTLSYSVVLRNLSSTSLNALITFPRYSSRRSCLISDFNSSFDASEAGPAPEKHDRRGPSLRDLSRSVPAKLASLVVPRLAGFAATALPSRHTRTE